MRWLIALFALLAPLSAQAISHPRLGMWAAAAGGLDLDSGSPVALSAGWSGSVGMWWGKYDDVYAMGRFHGVGITAQQAWSRDAYRIAPMVEYRAGADVIVVGYHLFAAVGPEFSGDVIGVSGLVGGGAKWRFQRNFGVGARAGVGAAFAEGTPTFRSQLQLTFEWAAPLTGS